MTQADKECTRCGKCCLHDLWIDQSRDDYEASRCPFVRKDRGQPTYKCTIYATRPQVCRAYVPWAAGSICEEVAANQRKIFGA